jgi:hypothetical protein
LNENRNVIKSIKISKMFQYCFSSIQIITLTLHLWQALILN